MVILLITTLAGKSDHPYLGAFIMILIGAFVFYAAFKQYRQYRILADAPKARVRSMPMGLGTCTARQPANLWPAR